MSQCKCGVEIPKNRKLYCSKHCYEISNNKQHTKAYKERGNKHE